MVRGRKAWHIRRQWVYGGPSSAQFCLGGAEGGKGGGDAMLDEGVMDHAFIMTRVMM